MDFPFFKNLFSNCFSSDLGYFFDALLKLIVSLRAKQPNYHVRFLDLLQLWIKTCARHLCLRPRFISFSANGSL